MKITFIGCLLLSTISWTQDFTYAKQLGGTDAESNPLLGLDANGNVYSAGSFKATADFDPGAGWNGATSNGDKDIYFNKLDIYGNFIWAKRIGGTGTDVPTAMVVDGSGNIYITGTFQNQVDFDPSPSGLVTLPGAAGSIFISKYDQNGNFIWVQKITSLDANVPNPTGNNFITTNSISLDNSGNVYYSGYFAGNIDFNPTSGSGNYFELASYGGTDAFISKLDNSGNFIWAKKIGGSSTDKAYSIKTDNIGNVYCAGSFQGTCDFDPGVGSLNITPFGVEDGFIAKLDQNGGFLWAKNFGGTNTCYSLSIVTDNSNSVFIASRFYGLVDFDPSASISNFNSNSASYDISITKLNSLGTYQWNKQIGGTGSEFPNGFAIDALGNIYMGGSFSGNVDFDPNAGSFNLNSINASDGFLLKLNNSGSFIWAKQNTGFVGASIGFDSSNSIYSAGTFSATVDFNTSAAVFNLTSYGLTDNYINKLSQCANTSGINTISSCSPYTWIDGITYSNSNNTATHTLPNAAGCDSIVTLNLTINTVNISVSNSNNVLSSQAIGATYQWLNCDNNMSVINGATSQSYTPTLNGNYAVKVTQNGCTDTSICVSITTVSMDEISPKMNFEVYPNPTNEKIIISFGLPQKYINLRLYSIHGQLITDKVYYQTDKFEYSILESNGVYILELTDDFNNISRLRILKQ